LHLHEPPAVAKVPFTNGSNKKRNNMQIKVVEILTGEIIEPAHIAGNRFWVQDEMDRPGRPKVGMPGKPLGVRRCGPLESPEWVGAYAILDPAREETADQKRTDLVRLESKLRVCRSELYRLYESPVKYEATMKLTATRTITVEACTLAEAKEAAQEAAEASYDDYSAEDWNVEDIDIEQVKPRSC
jgi:hypothetical protein